MGLRNAEVSAKYLNAAPRTSASLLRELGRNATEIRRIVLVLLRGVEPPTY
jgi:hypothetical protein